MKYFIRCTPIETSLLNFHQGPRTSCVEYRTNPNFAKRRTATRLNFASSSRAVALANHGTTAQPCLLCHQQQSTTTVTQACRMLPQEGVGVGFERSHLGAESLDKWPGNKFPLCLAPTTTSEVSSQSRDLEPHSGDGSRSLQTIF
jgi:hypothetical protein